MSGAGAATPSPTVARGKAAKAAAKKQARKQAKRQAKKEAKKEAALRKASSTLGASIPVPLPSASEFLSRVRRSLTAELFRLRAAARTDMNVASATSQADVEQFLSARDAGVPTSSCLVVRKKPSTGEIIDPTRKRCEVCLTEASQLLGGRLILKDADGTPTLICDACWQEHTLDKKQDTKERQIARQQRVAVDPTLPVAIFDKRRNMEENLLAFVAKAENRQYGKPIVKAMNPATGRVDSVPMQLAKVVVNKEKIMSPCANCKKHFLASQLRKCSRCRSEHYCGIVCQTADWKARHKHVCKAHSASEVN